MSSRVIVSIVLIAVLLAVAAGGSVALIMLRQPPPKHQPKPVVQTVVAPPMKAVDHVIQVVGYGSVRPRLRLQIAPLVAGEVVERTGRFYSGQYVRGGEKPDVLFRIDSEEYDLAASSAKEKAALLEAQLTKLAQEEANLRAIETVEDEQVTLSERQLARTRDVVASAAGTTNEVELAKADLLVFTKQVQTTRNLLAMIPQRRKELEVQLRSARIALQQAELDVKRTTVASPVDGRVIRCSVEMGEHVQVGQVCGELYSTTEMEIPISIPAGDLQWLSDNGRGDDVAPSSEATVLWTEPGSRTTHRWVGMVSRLEAGLQAGTRTAVLVVQVDDTKQPESEENRPISGRPLLDLNMYCKVVVDGRKLDKAFVVPRSAIQPGNFVYVVEDGRLNKQEVQVARFTEDEALILPGKGLSDGDRVILSYIPKPVHGMQLTILDAEHTASVAGGRDE